MPINRSGSHYEIEGFAKRLRETREARGMKRPELARLVGVTPNSVWGWETQFQRPRPEMLSKIASVLGTTEEFLKFGSDPDGDDPSGTDEPETVPMILEDAQRRAALATKMPPSRVRVFIEFLSS